MIEIASVTEVAEYVDGLTTVIFDLDDTLYSEKEYVRSGYHAVSGILSQVENCEEKLWKAFEEKKAAINEVLTCEGIYTDELKWQCLQTFRFHQPDIHLYDGVITLLGWLKKGGYKLGIITDGRPEGQWAKIISLELKKYMDQIIITDELGGIDYRKPNEKAFRLMREKMNVTFSEMCYVGDNVRKDFIAPEKLGMKSIWFRNRDGLYSEL